MKLQQHPLRAEMVAEIHARPPEVLIGPVRISYIAVILSAGHREREWNHLCTLLSRYGIETPNKSLQRASYDLGPFRVTFEQHGEFFRYLFIAPLDESTPFSEPVISIIPKDWLLGVNGDVIAANHVEIRPMPDRDTLIEPLTKQAFGDAAITGSSIGDGIGRAYSHFQIDHSGFGRVLILDGGMPPRQRGRMVQRLLEIDTYRMMALLALPVARQLAPFLTECERELARITANLHDATAADEQPLLDRLTKLEAAIEHQIANNEFRFGAASAYSDLVARRISELREQRLAGFATFKDFNDRRLMPAMATCATVMRRQESLSSRVARANELLATRIDITREAQNQKLLVSMDRRASIQLRLQQTVEGLSVAAFSYYVVGLIGYMAKGIKSAGLHVNAELVMGASIPFVILFASVGIHRIRRMVERANKNGS